MTGWMGMLSRRILSAGGAWMFFDYDGTLANFAPTPDQIIVDDELINLTSRLAALTALRIAVISGRTLDILRQLLPVPGIFLAGTYGIELQLPSGERLQQDDYSRLRPTIEQLKPLWEAEIADRQGFFLEDKGWALALHARFASESEAYEVLERARQKIDPRDLSRFRVLGGHRFLEVSPLSGNKGRTVEKLLNTYLAPGAVPIYVGDDDKDDEAFDAIHARGGEVVFVSHGQYPDVERRADHLVYSVQEVRLWLSSLASALEQG